MKQQEVIEYIEEMGDGEDVMVFTSPNYCEAFIGLSQDGRAVYDYDKMVEWLAKEEDMPLIDAVEFIEYNTIRSLPYYDDAPIVIYRAEEQEQRKEETRLYGIEFGYFEQETEEPRCYEVSIIVTDKNLFDECRKCLAYMDEEAEGYGYLEIEDLGSHLLTDEEIDKVLKSCECDLVCTGEGEPLIRFENKPKKY